MLSRQSQCSGHLSKQLHHLSEMIVVLVVVASFSRLEQKVSGDHFKNSAGKRPNISRTVVILTNDNFRGSVLSGLNLWGEVMVGPATITHVADLHFHVLVDFRAPPFHLVLSVLEQLLLLLSSVILH